jgi:hypothetical protein
MTNVVWPVAGCGDVTNLAEDIVVRDMTIKHVFGDYAYLSSTATRSHTTSDFTESQSRKCDIKSISIALACPSYLAMRVRLASADK